MFFFDGKIWIVNGFNVELVISKVGGFLFLILPFITVVPLPDWLFSLPCRLIEDIGEGGRSVEWGEVSYLTVGLPGGKRSFTSKKLGQVYRYN